MFSCLTDWKSLQSEIKEKKSVSLLLELGKTCAVDLNPCAYHQALMPPPKMDYHTKILPDKLYSGTLGWMQPKILQNLAHSGQL